VVELVDVDSAAELDLDAEGLASNRCVTDAVAG